MDEKRLICSRNLLGACPVPESPCPHKSSHTHMDTCGNNEHPGKQKGTVSIDDTCMAICIEVPNE